MSAGIHNPFAPKVKTVPKISKYEIGDLDSEGHIGLKPPTISLDGVNYVITFIGTDKLENVGEKLISLVYDVAKEHTNYLTKRGIFVGPKVTREDERALTVGGRQLTVYAPEDCLNEEAIYRRVAHALLGLPIKAILTKHHVTIMERSIA